MDNIDDWFGASSSGGLEALKMKPEEVKNIVVSAVRVSSAGIFRQHEYAIPSNEKWSIPAGDRCMILTTDDGDVLIYQQTAIDAIGSMLTTENFTSLDKTKTMKTTLPDGSTMGGKVLQKPWHQGVALFTISCGIKLIRGSGKYGQYTMEVV